MWSISWNIQHLVHQQSQPKIQWSMLQKGTFYHCAQANTANRQSTPRDDVIERMKAWAAWKQNWSEPVERCAVCDLQRSWRQGNDEKLTSQATERRRNGSRIMWIERPLSRDCELKTQGLQLSKSRTSAKKNLIRAEWLRQGGRAPSEPSETPRWRIAPRPVSIQPVALYIALRSLFHCLFAFCRSPIVNDHSRVVANCDNTSKWVHWVRACIGIAMQWVTLRISLLVFLLPARKIHFSLYQLYTSFQVARSMWLLTIHRSFRLSPVLLLVAISGITCAQPTIFPMLKTCKATAAGAFLTCTNFETGSKLPEFSGIVVSARANQNSTQAPSSFWSLMLNSRCSCHGRRPFSAPLHLPGSCFTHTQSFRRSPPRQLWLSVHRHIWDMRSPSKPSTWTLIPW